MVSNGLKEQDVQTLLSSDETLSVHELMIRWRIELKRAPCVEKFVIDETGKGIEVDFKDNYDCKDCPNEWCFKKDEWTEGCGEEPDRLPLDSNPPETSNIPGPEIAKPSLKPVQPVKFDNRMYG